MTNRVWLWGPVLLLMAVIFVLSAQPTLPAPPGGLTDKQAHALAYGTLAAAWFRAVAGGRARGLTVRYALIAIAGATLYGATDEFHQWFVPGRSADVADLLADFVGACIAAGAIWACGIIHARRQSGDAGHLS